MSKNLFHDKDDFTITSGLPKKGLPTLLEVKITYGKVGSGSLANLVTAAYIYRIRTESYIGGQIWECNVLETVKRTK